MKKVLILGVASVQMDAINELKKIGCETFACAMAKDGPGAEAADHFCIINILDETSIIKYIEENKIDAVYSTGSDLAMPVSSRISEKLGLPHFVSSRAAYICNHKNSMREALTKECIGNIPYQVMSSIDKVAISFPVILKPSDSQGQRGVFLVNSQEEFENFFEKAKSYSREGKVIVEKFISGPEISVNGYLVNSEIKFVVASDRVTWEKYTGLIHKHIVPATSINEETITKIKVMMEDACVRIGITNGPVYFQIKVENGNPYIIEMTPRLDGCHMWNVLRRSTGINLMSLTFNHLLFGDTDELLNGYSKFTPMELVFFCQEPNTIMFRENFMIPADAEYSFWYYSNSDLIRPVNGKFDKVGYFIKKI